jgi:2-keto-4-pentenoate hydratase/2-oxohepta-3-ene-1,7-dioic acid hydratase in catechol pathway
MILSPEKIISCLSRDMTLNPGDVIACGTSIGARPVKPGMTVEVAIEGIGTLPVQIV